MPAESLLRWGLVLSVVVNVVIAWSWRLNIQKLGQSQQYLLAAFRVKLEDRLATVTGAREGADSAAVARELDCEHALDHLDKALQVHIAVKGFA